MLNNIDKFRFYCQKILPLVYDDSLSYVEVLYKMAAKLNEVITDYNELIEFYNSVEGTLDEINKKIVEIDTRLDGFTQELIDFEAKITGQVDFAIEEMNTNFDNLSRELQNEINALSQRIEIELRTLTTDLTNLINTELRNIRVEMQINDKEMKAWVEKRLQDFLEEIPDVQNVLVIDPTSGKLVKLQDALDNMFEFSRYGGITAGEYDSLKLTAYRYDHFTVHSIPRGLTAYEYDFYARKFFHIDDRVEMYHPNTGEVVEQKVVIAFNTDLLKVSGALNAEEYDDLLMTAGDYDALELTAHEYDWFGNRKLA